MSKKQKSGSSVAESFVGGLICTLIFLVLVPVVCDIIIQPIVEDEVGDTTFMTLSSSLIVAIIMLIVMFAFSFVIGAGGILRKFGIVGIIAMILAYWLIGRIEDCVIPLLCLVIVWAVTGRKQKN